MQSAIEIPRETQRPTHRNSFYTNPLLHNLLNPLQVSLPQLHCLYEIILGIGFQCTVLQVIFRALQLHLHNLEGHNNGTHSQRISCGLFSTCRNHVVCHHGSECRSTKQQKVDYPNSILHAPPSSAAGCPPSTATRSLDPTGSSWHSGSGPDKGSSEQKVYLLQ